MAASLSQLQKLGYTFIYDDGSVFVLRPAGYGKTAALERLRGETKESLESQGIEVSTESVSQYSSLPGFGYSGGDVGTLAQVLDSAGSTVDAITQSLSVQEGDQINVGNDEQTTRSALENILDESVTFSQAALDAQNAQGEAAAQTKDAETATTTEMTRAEKNAARIAASGKVPTSIQKNEDGTYSVLNESTGDVLQAGLKSRAEALTIGQQLSGGSTPTIAGRPDLYAAEPTQAEKDATYGKAFDSYVDESGVTVTPRVATEEDFAQLEAGTLESYNDAIGVTEEGTTGGTTSGTMEGTTGGTTDGTTDGTTEPGTDYVNFSDLPQWILDSEEWNNLSDEYKEIYYYTYNMQQLTDKAGQLDAAAALEEAMAIADPYLAEALRISADTLSRGIASVESDYESQKTTLEKHIEDLEEDLTYNKEQLSLEQQSDLASILASYKSELFNLQQTAAEAGLAFSSPRSTAESELAAENEGLVASTNRTYNQLLREQELEASRGTETAQQSLSDLDRSYLEALTELQRQSETTAGSENTAAVTGVSALGDITGTLQEEYQADLIKLQEAALSAQDPFDFTT
jgi:hypothetical protein